MVERDETVVDAGRVVTATRTAEVRVPSARTELRFDDAEPAEDRAEGGADDRRRRGGRRGRGLGGGPVRRPPLGAAARPLPRGSRRVRRRGRRADRPGALRVPAAGGAGDAGARGRHRGRGGCRAARALVGARGGRRVARRLPGVPPPPGADGGSHPGPPRGADGGHAPSLRRGGPRAGRLGRTRPRPPPAGGFRGGGRRADDLATRPGARRWPTPRGRGRRAGAAEVVEEERPALPRLRPTPPPPLPAGTALVEDEEEELDLDDGSAPGYRRAVGQ